MGRQNRSHAALLVALVLAAPEALADPAAAQALFDQGKGLVQSGDVDAACPMFVQSQRLDPSPGTLASLADCEERRGRTATAWATFLSAATLARTQGRTEIVGPAEARARALQPKLSRLVVRPSLPVRGLVVLRNDTRFDDASLGTRIPVDPGEYHIRAEAPGHRSWSTSVRVTGEGALVEVTVPALEALPSGPRDAAPLEAGSAMTATPQSDAPPQATPPARDSSVSSLRVAGLLTAGFGVVGLGIAVGFHLDKESKLSSRDTTCPGAPDVPCESDTKARQFLAYQEAAQRSASASLVSGVVGGALVATGLVLVIAAPSGNGGTGGLQVGPMVGRGDGGVAAWGRW